MRPTHGCPRSPVVRLVSVSTEDLAWWRSRASLDSDLRGLSSGIVVGLRLFTWNLHLNPDILGRALSYLSATGSPFLACFQESKRLSRLDYSALAAHHGCQFLEALQRSKSPGDLVAFASNDVKNKRSDPRPLQRIVALELDVFGNQLFAFLLHGLDRRNHEQTSASRLNYAANLRPFMRAFSGRDDDVGTIVMGDLNAQPFDHEILTGAGLWAVFEKHDLDQRLQRLVGAQEMILRPLFNPMWSCIQRCEESGRFTGTSYFKPPGGGPLCHWLDQIIVSEDLSNAICASPRILDSIDGVPTRTQSAKGRPGQAHVSDHLPVELDIGLPQKDNQ